MTAVPVLVGLRDRGVAAITAMLRVRTAGRLTGRVPIVSLYLVQGAIVAAIFVMGLGTRRFFANTPIVAYGDALHHLTIARAIIDQGWYESIDRLSWPFSLPMGMFPVGGTLDYGVFELLSFFTSDPSRLVTTFFGLTFVFAAAAAFYVSRDLGLDLKSAFAFGLIFAFCPFPFYRSTAHLMLVTYLIPFAIGFCVHLMRGSFAALSSRRRAVYFVAAGALGANYIYTTFFSCFFVGLSVLPCLFTRTWRRSAGYAAAFIGIAVAAAVIVNVPAIVAAHKDPEAARQLYGYKSVADSEVLGLKIRQLLVPNGKIPGFAKISDRWANNNFPLENENRSARLGLVASIGFLALLLIAFYRLAFPRAEGASQFVETTSPLSVLLIGGVLFATIGGFGSIFNVFVSQEIRAYNRIAPFLFFISTTGVAFMLAYASRRLSEISQAALLLLIVVGAIAEQSEFGALRNGWQSAFVTSDPIKRLVERLEQSLPKGAAIYQFPHTAYPHTPNINQMEAQEHLLGYVFSQHLNWSYPAMSSVATNFNNGVWTSPKDAVEKLATVGFAAIWINRAGYPEGAKDIMNDLRGLGLPEIDHDDGNRIAVFSLAPIASRLRAAEPEAELERRRKAFLFGSDPAGQPR